MIMNGALVAGVHDNSAIYYNPAALSHSDNEGLDISLFAVSIESLNNKNLYNTGSDHRNTTFELTPGLITFNIRPFKNKNISLSAGGLTRHNFNNRSYEQVTTRQVEGIQVNEIQFEHAVREYWLAGAISYLFEKNFSIGFSQYLSIRKERYDHDLSYRLFDADDVGSLLFEETEKLVFHQNHTFGLNSKLGLTWNNDLVKIGATITTPLFGRMIKTTDVNYERTSIDAGGASAATVFSEKKGTERRPLIARVGIEFKGKSLLIASAVEYFNSVNEFDLISSSPKGVQALVNGEEEFALKDSRKRIFNINLGWEIVINEKFRYLGGLRTNFNFNEQPADYTSPRLHFSYFDIYHITNGLKINVKRSNFTMGFDYAFSYNDGLPPLADLSANSSHMMPVTNSAVAYNNVTILFTYNFIIEKFSGISEK